MYTTVMVSGSTTVDSDFFNEHYKEKMDIDLWLEELKELTHMHKNIWLKLAMTQKWSQLLIKELKIIGFLKNGFSSYTERDAWMTTNSNIDLAVLKQYGGGGSGTFANIVRRELGNDIAKKVMKLFRDNAEPFSS